MRLNRHRAAAVHLGLSTLIVCTVLALILLQWYPGIWFASMGGRNLLFILAGVDIIVGPLLTWIVFRPGKPTLKFDLSVIAALQFAALLYGLHVLYGARPAFMVFLRDQFRTVSAAELDPVLQAQARYPEFRVTPANGPRLATAETPSDPTQRQSVIYAAAVGLDLHLLPQFWAPYDGQEALRAAQPLPELRAIAPANGPALESFLQEHGRTEGKLRFLPLRTRHKEMAALLDATNGDVIGIIDAKPWR